MPKTVLAKMEGVIDMATKGKTTLFKASELLEFTLEPFHYARRSALDSFDLMRRYVHLTFYNILSHFLFPFSIMILVPTLPYLIITVFTCC